MGHYVSMGFGLTVGAGLAYSTMKFLKWLLFGLFGLSD